MLTQELPEARDSYERKILSDILKIGWSIIGIPEDDARPAYAYSVGISRTLKHPELTVMGANLNAARTLINDLATKLRRVPAVENVNPYQTVVPDRAFLKVDSRYFKEYFGFAVWLHDGLKFSMLQLIQPDRSGALPWDDKYDGQLFQEQRLLGLTPRFPHGWPFPDPPNAAVFTSRQVIKERESILHVSRDFDGAWQFHTGEQVDVKDGMIVGLEEMLRHDPTLSEVGSLPLGGKAHRTQPWEPWVRKEES